MSNESSLGITPTNGYSSSLGLVYNSVFPTKSNAAILGNLAQNSTDINVLSQLDQNVSQNYYKFNFTSGSALKLAFNTTTSFSNASILNPAGSQTDAVAANLRFQLYDITGNLIADSGGTPEQQTAYADLTSSSGLSAANGTYTVKVSSAPTRSITSPTSYNFQLYSGSTYTENQTYSAQTQAFDPNLFAAASDTVTPAGNIKTYTNSATLSGTQASALNIGALDANQSELYASSQVNHTNQSAYYSFNFNSGSAIKFNLYNTTSPSLQQPLQVQLFDSSGKIVADSNGTEAQQEAYKKFDSGEGLSTANGKYTVKVTYAPGSYTTSAQKYNFQIYSGSTYNTQYKTTAGLPSSNTNGQVGQNIGIFADSQAKLFTRQEYHTIGETADSTSSPSIGWLYENKAASDVISQLTHVDSVDYYNFTLQKGSNLKLSFQNQTNTAATRFQLLDPSGTYVIADNYGTDAQKKAFASLTSSAGLAAKPQNYAVKVTYAPGADTTNKQTYNFQLYSGNSYTNLYKFTASAETYQNAVQTGNAKVTGYNPKSAAVGYLNSQEAGSDTTVNLFSDLSLFI